MPDTVLPGSIEWCIKWQVRVAFFDFMGRDRVKITIPGAGSICYEGATIEEAANLCEDRLQRQAHSVHRQLLRRFRG